jgi:aryl-alcohol dehydrogenase-like predicted oxidoreductase
LTPTLIPGTDLAVHPICLGLGDFGTRVAGDDALRLLEGFLAAGGNFVDTAHCYSFWVPEGGLGASERQLGECLRRLGCRDQVVIATKGGHPDGGKDYPREDLYLSPVVVACDLDESFERLDIDAIDLYLLHRDDPRVPVGEVIEMLNREVASGDLRYLGASNWSTERIAAANEYAAAHDLRGFCVSQVHWSLAEPKWDIGPDPTMRHVTAADAAWHEASGLPVMAYSASAGGYFAGREGAEGGYGTPTNAARRERARELAAELGATPTQVALAYLLGQPFPVYPIVGALDQAHLAEAMGAADIELDPEQVRWLRDGDRP